MCKAAWSPEKYDRLQEACAELGVAMPRKLRLRGSGNIAAKEFHDPDYASKTLQEMMSEIRQHLGISASVDIPGTLQSARRQCGLCLEGSLYEQAAQVYRQVCPQKKQGSAL